ncbi:MAG TPA: bis(5'-nucleosyl)-tetraphosphatase (symmetrical) YqeK [Bacilli bacterium]
MKTVEEYERLLWKKYQQADSHNIKERFEHSIGVKNKALELIDTFGLNIDRTKAAVAGILHDYAKYEKPERFQKIVQKYKLDENILNMHPEILHSLLGPFVIKEELGLDDPEILSAISNHTLGSLDMSPLDEVIFLADYTEEGRKGPWFEEAKKLSHIDFYGAILEKIKNTLALFPDEHNQKLYQKYTEVKCRS